jgi:hypothetical protein
MSDVNCPYCNEEIKIDHEDGYGYEQEILHEQHCSKCDKSFVYQTYIHFTYDVYKADCLNGSDHKFKLSNTFPIEFSRMVCEDCWHERPLTEEERISHNIGTVKEYFKKLDTKHTL